MKGLTHNLLACLKCSAFPLKLTVSEADQLECEFDAEHVVRILPKLDWKGLVALAADLKEFLDADVAALPAEMPEDIHKNEPVLRTLHHLTMEIKVQNGSLECPSCSTKFQIKDSIPNMVLNEAGE
eukprot:TRINITY_DN27505_c0_g1_i1.p2 TRINITY_DN27505_c0_g1~~TRINITY_DN27505_c0_g1_i1.p2  ORF type:complete len:126 (+),score=37.53 TRINITY_DN27505_c0_g1_i1:45-422(+)